MQGPGLLHLVFLLTLAAWQGLGPLAVAHQKTGFFEGCERAELAVALVKPPAPVVRAKDRAPGPAALASAPSDRIETRRVVFDHCSPLPSAPASPISLLHYPPLERRPPPAA